MRSMAIASVVHKLDIPACMIRSVVARRDRRPVQLAANNGTGGQGGIEKAVYAIIMNMMMMMIMMMMMMKTVQLL